MSAAPSMMLLLLLLPPVAAGIVLIIMSRRKGNPFPACGQCGYNVSASIGTTTRCPECGGEFGDVGITPTKSRTNHVTLWLGIALAVVPLTCIGIGSLSLIATQRQVQAQRAAAAAAAAQAAALQAQVRASAQFRAAPHPDIAAAQQVLARATTDPAVVDGHRIAVAALSLQEASDRVSAIVQELGEDTGEEPIDDQRLNDLRAELRALIDHIQPQPTAPVFIMQTPAHAIPPPLTQDQINAMNETELRQALMRVSKARPLAANDPTLTERLKTEFMILMDELREAKEGHRN